ncbi:pyridoxamine 5'-phosphate oxidase family protein [Ideonella sp.]|uniref:pyridoxamine 5'-phosphate oxidase family protein n=1 Tax=Ideonella sp. TaxID=1929293 RepID=UPI0035B37AE0
MPDAPAAPAGPPPDLTLPELRERLWDELVAAAGQRAHPWRTPVLATVGQAADGAVAADARTVVLREVDAPARELVFFTDARSPKAAQLAAHPQATLVCWSAALGWQLRLAVTLTLEHEGLAVSTRWARLKMSPAADDYLSPLPPGTPVAHPAPERGTRAHFAVVTARVDRMDWLALAATGHRRAAFDADGARWLQP